MSMNFYANILCSSTDFGFEGIIIDFHDKEDSSWGLLSCDAICRCGRIQTFGRTLLPSSAIFS